MRYAQVLTSLIAVVLSFAYATTASRHDSHIIFGRSIPPRTQHDLNILTRRGPVRTRFDTGKALSPSPSRSTSTGSQPRPLHTTDHRQEPSVSKASQTPRQEAMGIRLRVHQGGTTKRLAPHRVSAMRFPAMPTTPFAGSGSGSSPDSSLQRSTSRSSLNSLASTGTSSAGTSSTASMRSGSSKGGSQRASGNMDAATSSGLGPSGPARLRTSGAKTAMPGMQRQPGLPSAQSVITEKMAQMKTEDMGGFDA